MTANNPQPLSDSFAQQALARLPDSVLGVGADGTVTAYQPGCPVDGVGQEAVGERLTACLPAGAANVLQSGIEAAQAAATPQTVVYAVPKERLPAPAKAEGAGAARAETAYVEARIVPTAEGVLCYLRDVTEQRLAEQRLIRRELTHGALTQIYHRLLMAAPDAAPVTPDTLSMLGYAAGAEAAYFVDLVQTALDAMPNAVGLLWQAQPAKRAGRPLTVGDHLARRPLTRWLPALRSGRPVQVTPASGGHTWTSNEDAGHGMSLLIPVLVQDELVALLGFDQTQRRSPWPAEEVDLLRAAATAIAFHMERTRYLAQLEASAEEIAQMNVDLADARDLARASDRAKSEFLAVVGHELRTPLNPVISMTEMLLSSSLTAEQREYAEMAHDAGQTLLHQINAILDYIEIETGNTQPQRLPFDPTAQVELVGDLMKSRARSKELTLMTFCHPETPVRLYGDPERVRQVLEKLVDNALKFTADGEVIVRVAPTTPPAADAQVCELRFSVSDTGIGLAADADRWLFKPFTQADATSTRSYGGTGLGLATAKQWVTAMGGEIGARANPGGGTVFWFTIPLDLPADSSRSASQVGVARRENLAGLRVLVVDDLESNRRILMAYLRQWRVACDGAGDPREALSLLQRAQRAQRPYHVALVDLMLPEMDGIALATAIQQRELSPSTRLILVTAYDEHGQDMRARRSGFSAYLTKPLRRDGLYDALVHVMATVDAPVGLRFTVDGTLTRWRSTPVETDDTDDRWTQEVVRPLAVLIEANTILRRMAAGELTRAGFEVQAVANETAAIREVQKAGTAALVLLDPQRHGKTLRTVVQRLRASRTRGDSAMAVVAMAAQLSAGARAACIAAGLDDCIAKPLTPATVATLYARWGKVAR